jgi:hypothetical protein
MCPHLRAIGDAQIDGALAEALQKLDYGLSGVSPVCGSVAVGSAGEEELGKVRIAVCDGQNQRGCPSQLVTIGGIDQPEATVDPDLGATNEGITILWLK